VGGAVRDLVQGVRPRDFDLATDLEPRAVAAALEGVDLRAERYGTSLVRCQDRELTVTTLRADEEYVDRRRPRGVRFVTEVAADALRRDFTVNALYLDPSSGCIEDPCGGMADLRQGVLRCIGDPATRFDEDALRMLRMVRFAASAGLEIEPAAAAAARGAALSLCELSAERVYAELTDMFTGRGRGAALRLLVTSGLAASVLPEVVAMDGVAQPPEYHPEGDVLTHVIKVLEQVPGDDPVLAWSAVLHDTGKPDTYRVAEDRIRFDGHDTLSAKIADDVLERLRAPKALREQVVDVCLQHIRFAALPAMRPGRAERWMRSPGFDKHLAFHLADCMGSHQKREIYDQVRAEFSALPPLKPPLLQGRDVLELGVPRGPLVGELIREVERMVDELPGAATRREALDLLRDAVARLGDADRDRRPPA